MSATVTYNTDAATFEIDTFNVDVTTVQTTTGNTYSWLNADGDLITLTGSFQYPNGFANPPTGTVAQIAIDLGNDGTDDLNVAFNALQPILADLISNNQNDFWSAILDGEDNITIRQPDVGDFTSSDDATVRIAADGNEIISGVSVTSSGDTINVEAHDNAIVSGDFDNVLGTLTGGDDNITIDPSDRNDRVPIQVNGDANSVEGTVNGGNDTFILTENISARNGSTTPVSLSGDAGEVINGGQLIGGADVFDSNVVPDPVNFFNVRGEIEYLISGDATTVDTISTIVGGDDIIDLSDITSPFSGGPTIVGDVDTVVLNNAGLSGSIIGGDDIITGTENADTIYGDVRNNEPGLFVQGGDDIIHGGGGSDNIFGNGGNDELFGDSGNDLLIGGEGDDLLDGGSGSDSVSYFDSLFGVNVTLGQNGGNGTATGNGNDTLISIENVGGSNQNDNITGNEEINFISLGEGDDIVSAGGGDDFIRGIGGNNTINAGDGDDRITSGTGNDIIDGGDGVDSLEFFSSGDTSNVNIILGLNGGNGSVTSEIIGNDTIRNIENLFTGSTNDNIRGNEQDNIIVTRDGNDTVRGGDGDDRINSFAGTNLLEGEDGNDIISGGSGDDTINGGEGDDIISAGRGGVDVLDGGNGNDTLNLGDVFRGDEGATVNLVTSSISGLIYDDDTIMNFENVIGSRFNDILIGNDIDNILNGGTGDDSIIGGDGDDMLFGDSGNDTINGGDGNDTIEGGSGNNDLNGGSGNDRIIVSFSNDTVDGGSGIDTIVFENEAGDYRFNLNASNDLLIQDTILFGTTDEIENVEIFEFENSSYTRGETGTSASNTIIGNADNEIIFGLAGNDTLNGASGNDIIIGGQGADRLSGGGGDDIIDGGVSGDILNGNGGDDIILGGFGNDRIDGGTGIDTVDYSGFGGNITVNLNQNGNPQTAGGGGVDEIINVENIIGGDFADRLTGLSGDTEINGGAGGDRIFGLGGNDSLFGGEANDFIQGGNGNDIINGERGQDQLNGGAGNDTLIGGGNEAELDRLTGAAGNDILDGGGGRDILRGDSFDTATGMSITGGADIFDYNSIFDSRAGGQRDIIRDFVQGEDLIDLSDIDGNPFTTDVDDPFTFIGRDTFSGTAGELRFQDAGRNVVVSIDFNGNGTADMQIQLNGNFELEASDFIL